MIPAGTDTIKSQTELLSGCPISRQTFGMVARCATHSDLYHSMIMLLHVINQRAYSRMSDISFT